MPWAAREAAAAWCEHYSCNMYCALFSTGCLAADAPPLHARSRYSAQEALDPAPRALGAAERAPRRAAAALRPAEAAPRRAAAARADLPDTARCLRVISCPACANHHDVQVGAARPGKTTRRYINDELVPRNVLADEHTQACEKVARTGR